METMRIDVATVERLQREMRRCQEGVLKQFSVKFSPLEVKLSKAVSEHMGIESTAGMLRTLLWEYAKQHNLYVKLGDKDGN